MLLNRTLLITLLFLFLPVQADETPWHGSLIDGSQITIDPHTNKATRTADGITTPLWDGVHQLSNGAVIIVRDGVVVKDAAIIREEKEQQKEELVEACGKLVRKVCGPRNECADQQACDPARQLLAMEREELRKGGDRGVPETARQCLEALSNEAFFQLCTARGATTPLSPCERLQRRVCGEHDQCANTEACDVAGQLVEMEVQDRYASPEGYTYATAQCEGVLNNNDFFKACK